MAHYAALWTSSSDPEFIQMKKVKQLTERYLAMNITDMKEEHRRHVKKAQERIRENQDVLDRLEKEKEAIARSILSRFHRYHRLKEKARQMKFNFRKRKESKASLSLKENNEGKLPKVTSGDQQTEEIRANTKRSKVIMTHTFPFVYHSYGDKPCSRYDMFLESQEYGPPEITSKQWQRQHPNRRSTTKQARDQRDYKKPKCMVDAKDDNKLPSLLVSSPTHHHTLNKVALAVQAISELKKSTGGPKE